MKKLLCFLLMTTLANISFAQERKSEEVFVVKPYLQIGRNPSPTSLQLMWQVKEIKENEAWAVEYRISTNDKWRKAGNLTITRIAVGANLPRKLFNATLIGLTSGGTFDYRLLKGGKVVFASEGQASKSPEQPYRFVAFGDIGAGTPEQKPLAYRAFLSKPDLVVVPGDIVYERGLVSEYDTTFWPIYNADIANEAGAPLMRSVPFAAAPGNHDTDTRDLNKYPDALAYYMFWNQPLNGPLGEEGGAIVPSMVATETNKKAFLEAAGEAYPKMTNYSFDYGNAHWTVLDSNPYVDWTNKELNEWVANDLASAKNATWRFVMFHHPGFNSAREHYEQQHMRLLSTLFEEGKVDIVFTGHVHNYQRSFPMTFVADRKGTLLVGGKENKTVRGRVVTGRWTLDKSFNSQTDTSPKGVIYLVTGAGGQTLYNPEQTNDPDSWQKFTDKFISNTHSLTIADVDGKTLTVKQVNAEGKELDSFKIVKE